MAERVSWEEAVRSLIDDPAQAELVRACYFDPPVQQAARRFHQSDEWRAVRAVIGPPAGQALDIGAGNGILSYALAADGWETSALEPDPSNLVGSGAIRTLAADLGKPIEVLEGYGESVPAEDGRFSLIVARQVLHHAADLAAFCREMKRVLKPGGRFFSYRDHVVSGPEQLPQFFAQHALHRLYGGENAFREREYSAAIETAGLAIRRSWRHFDAPFNYAPKSAFDVVNEAASRLSPAPPPSFLATIASSGVVYPVLGRLLSVLDRRPGRCIAFLAEKTHLP